MKLKINKRIIDKLQRKHQVSVEEIQECFYNRQCGFLLDTRLVHSTTPPTRWFIAETDQERALKVVFIILTDGTCEIKTAYEPNDNEVKIYERFA